MLGSVCRWGEPGASERMTKAGPLVQTEHCLMSGGDLLEGRRGGDTA